MCVAGKMEFQLDKNLGVLLTFPCKKSWSLNIWIQSKTGSPVMDQYELIPLIILLSDFDLPRSVPDVQEVTNLSLGRSVLSKIFTLFLK